LAKLKALNTETFGSSFTRSPNSQRPAQAQIDRLQPGRLRIMPGEPLTIMASSVNI
jgi:hypothetical protein